MAAPNIHTVVFIFGILGMSVSVLVLLAPIQTFYRIYKRKSAEGFQSLPYSVALFSAMLMLYYAYIKTDSALLLAINTFGTIMETIYLIAYMIYAPSKSRIFTAKLVVLFNVVGYGAIVAITYQIPNHCMQLKVVGWLNVLFSICVFAAPLSILRLVVKTKSTEYMSLPLSLCLTVCAVMWFFYGLLIKDMFVAFPNILGLSFGMGQMILFFVYRNTPRPILLEYKINEMPNCRSRVAAASDEGIIVTTSEAEMKTAEAEMKTAEAEMETGEAAMKTGEADREPNH